MWCEDLLVKMDELLLDKECQLYVEVRTLISCQYNSDSNSNLLAVGHSHAAC